MKTLTVRLLTAAASITTIAALGVAGAGAANAATTTPTTNPTHTSTGVPFRAISEHAIRAEFGTVPTALKTDIKALHGKKGSDRKSAVASIETKALNGSYGTDVKTAATDAKAAWSSAPASFKSALKDARHAKKTDKQKDFAALEAKALAGGYGSAMETYAKNVQSNVQKQQAERLGGAVGSII
jgi:hypothetical protein